MRRVTERPISQYQSSLHDGRKHKHVGNPLKGAVTNNKLATVKTLTIQYSIFYFIYIYFFSDNDYYEITVCRCAFDSPLL